MLDLKQPENVGYFSYLCSLITNVARGTRSSKSRIVMAKVVPKKKKKKKKKKNKKKIPN
jgi:hypothetical protein